MTAEDFLKDPEWININMRCIEIRTKSDNKARYFD